MPRIKPTDMVDIVGHLDRNLHDSVAEYMYSKQQRNYFRKPPNVDGLLDTVELFYLHCAKEHGIALEMQHDAYVNNKRLEIFNGRREMWLCKDQSNLRLRFIELTNKLKNLRNKEIAAQGAVDVILKDQTYFIKRIKEQKVELTVLNKFSKVFKKTVQRYICYEELLQEVVTHNPRYTSVDDFITRTDALLLASIEINRMNRIFSHQLESFRNELVSKTREIASSTMKMKNELDFFSRAYTKQYAEVLDLEENLLKAKMVCINRELNKFRMVEGMYHLYTLLCKRRQVDATLKNTDFDQVCMFIKEEFDVLSWVANRLEMRKLGK